LRTAALRVNLALAERRFAISPQTQRDDITVARLAPEYLRVPLGFGQK